MNNSVGHLVKIAHYHEELEGFRSDDLVIPRRVQIDPVAVCNHDCGFCTYRYTRDEDMNALFDLKDVISFPKMVEIFDDCVELGVKAIELTGGGEPSLHRDFPLILSELNNRGLEIGLITNGVWRKVQFDSIVEELGRAEWVRFSLDAATAETHVLTHGARRGDFDRVIEAIRALVGFDVTVGISFIVQKQNMHEIYQAARLAERLGVDYIRFGGVVFEGEERVDDIELSLDEHEQASLLISELCQDVEVIDNFTSRSCANFERYGKDDTCFYSYLGCTIGADLRLYPCCVWKYRPAGVVADLNEVGFADAWRGGAMDRFYESFDISQQCTRCYLKDKNDFVAELLNPTPKHLNFV